jgi:hypothetical protein
MKLEGLSFRDRFDILLLKLTEGQRVSLRMQKSKCKVQNCGIPTLSG